MSTVIRIKGTSNLRFYPSFDSLPELVARDEGLYAEEGVEVQVIEQAEAWRTTPTGEADVEAVDSFSRHYAFEEASEPEVFVACEWGNLRRSYDSKRGGRGASRRVLTDNQAIIVAPDSPFLHARELADQPVAVRFHAGSHYAALELLEGFIPRNRIKVVNYDHLAGYEAVRAGEIAAVTLMEPWITLARKQGFQVLAETRQIGLEVAAPGTDPAAYAAYNRARSRAADRINADKRTYITRYFDHLLGSLDEEHRGLLAPEDFDPNRFRWWGPLPYRPEDFQRTYDWLVGWGLIGDDASYERLVDRNLALSG